MDAISTAGAGLVKAVSRLDAASANLSNAFSGSSNADPAAAVVEQTDARTAFQASLATLKTADKMFKALLDITV